MAAYASAIFVGTFLADSWQFRNTGKQPVKYAETQAQWFSPTLTVPTVEPGAAGTTSYPTDRTGVPEPARRPAGRTEPNVRTSHLHGLH